MGVLFSQVLYLANLEDPIFQNDIINNREDFQKYLLATGYFCDSIHEILDLVVANGRLNDGTAIRHESDLNLTTIFF